MVSRFIDKHVAEFRDCYPEPPTISESEPEGSSPSEWFTQVQDAERGPTRPGLPVHTNRHKLLQMASDPHVDVEDLCITVLAWGGMHRENGRLLFKKSRNRFLDVANLIRNRQMNRSEAYDAFAEIRAAGDEMQGLGPAYFTKLIYFLMPGGSGQGYILDQWAGVSVNVLTERNVVCLNETVEWRGKGASRYRDVSSRVSDVNTGADYEAFCGVIEALSDLRGGAWTPGLVERALMSRGGRKRERWRAYVVERRRLTLPVLLTASDP